MLYISYLGKKGEAVLAITSLKTMEKELAILTHAGFGKNLQYIEDIIIHSFLVGWLVCFNWKADLQSKIFHLLVHSPMAAAARAEPIASQKPKAFSKSPT